MYAHMPVECVFQHHKCLVAVINITVPEHRTYPMPTRGEQPGPHNDEHWTPNNGSKPIRDVGKEWKGLR